MRTALIPTGGCITSGDPANLSTSLFTRSPYLLAIALHSISFSTQYSSRSPSPLGILSNCQHIQCRKPSPNHYLNQLHNKSQIGSSLNILSDAPIAHAPSYTSRTTCFRANPMDGLLHHLSLSLSQLIHVSGVAMSNFRVPFHFVQLRPNFCSVYGL